MTVDPVLFDLKCVSLGLPPLFEDSFRAAGMIFDLPAEKRRKLSRKIRKIVKSEIKKQCLEIRNEKKREYVKNLLQTKANLGNNKDNFSKHVLANRLSIVKNHVMRSMSSEALNNASQTKF